jgi:hypothetical protein
MNGIIGIFFPNVSKHKNEMKEMSFFNPMKAFGICQKEN